MRIRTALFWIAVGSAATLSFSVLSQHKASASTSPAAYTPAISSKVIAASPGRVEGASDPVEIGAAADGVIASVLATEGEFVERGAVLAEIACGDVEAELKAAEAQREVAEQQLSRLLAGSRPEERDVAAQKVKTAQAVFEDAARFYNRIQPLAAKDAVSQVSLDKARKDFEVAQSEVQEALRNQRLVDAPPMKEDVGRAQAEVDAAAGRVRVFHEKIAKCVVRAPISGTITRNFARPGQSFSTLMPRPLFTIADTSSRRVRAQLDERDIAFARIGQKVEIVADAYSDRTFKGTVVQIYPALGRKTMVTGDPTDKTDRDVLEVMIRLDADAKVLPLGLRVAVQFLETSRGN